MSRAYPSLVCCSRAIDATKVFRCLGKSRIPAYGCGPTPSASALSKYCKDYFHVWEDGELANTDLLKDRLAALGVKFILPSDDRASRILRSLRNGNFFPDSFFLAPSEEAYSISDDKYQFYQWCLKNSFSTPQTWLPGDPLRLAFDRPMMIKRRIGTGGHDYHLLSTSHALPEGTDPSKFIVQELLDGYDISVNASCINGDIISHFTQECVRQDKMFGPQIQMRISNFESDATKLAEAVLKKLDWHGPAVVDIRASKDSMHLLEINSRFGRALQAGLGVGINLPATLVHKASPSDQNTTAREFVYPARALKNPSLLFSAQYLTGRRYTGLYIHLADPAPDIAASLRKRKHLLEKVKTKAVR